MSQHAPRFNMLAEFSRETSSEGRRELLRKVTDAISVKHPACENDALSELDDMLAAVADDYSGQVRAEIAKLVASSTQFGKTASHLAMDDIEIASPILINSRIVNDATLLKVIAKSSQPHMMAVTQRRQISETISSALVTAGDDFIVVSLLSNDGASIGQETFETVAERAQTRKILQAPLVRRKDVPVELFNDLYTKVEASLRQEILQKFESVSPDEIDKAFLRSRHRLAKRQIGLPEDFDAAMRRVDDLIRRSALKAPGLVALLREGPQGRTTFVLAFARLADVEFDLVHRAVNEQDLDTISLLCRGAGFDRPLYVTLAISLKNSDARTGPTPEELGRVYEGVPVQAAQRAIRFWKVRAAA